MNIDGERLRRDLINYLGTAFYAGFGPAVVEISEIENATLEQLVEIALKYGFNIEEYKIRNR